MIYLKNETTSQEVWIPRQEQGNTYVSPCERCYNEGYEEGYADGTATCGELEEGSVVVTADTQTALPSSGYVGFSQVEIDATDYGQDKYDEGYASGHTEGMADQKALLITTAFTHNDTYELENGWSAVTVNVPETSCNLQHKTEYLDERASGVWSVTPDSGYDGMYEVYVVDRTYGQSKYDEGVSDTRSAMTSTAFTQNDTYTNASGWSAVTVSVPQTGSSCNLQSKSVSMSASTQTFYPDGGSGGGRASLLLKNGANIVTNFIPYTAYTGDSNYLKIEIDCVWNGSRKAQAYLFSCMNDSVPFFSCERFRTSDNPYVNIGNGNVSNGPTNGTSTSSWALVINNGVVTTYIDGVQSGTASISGSWPSTALRFAPSANALNLDATFYSLVFKDSNDNVIANFVPNDHNGGAIKDTIANEVYDVSGTGSATYQSGIGYDGMSAITVDATSVYNSGYTSGQTNVRNGMTSTAFTQNSVYTNASGWSAVTVNVPTGSSCNLQDKSVIMTATTETFYPDSADTWAYIDSTNFDRSIPITKVRFHMNNLPSGSDYNATEGDFVESPNINTDGLVPYQIDQQTYAYPQYHKFNLRYNSGRYTNDFNHQNTTEYAITGLTEVETGVYELDFGGTVYWGGMQSGASSVIYTSGNLIEVCYSNPYDGMSAITVDASGLCQDYYDSGYTDGQSTCATLQASKSVTLSADTETITPDSGYDAMEEVQVDASQLCQDYYDSGWEVGYKTDRVNYISFAPYIGFSSTTEPFAYDADDNIVTGYTYYNDSGIGRLAFDTDMITGVEDAFIGGPSDTVGYIRNIIRWIEIPFGIKKISHIISGSCVDSQLESISLPSTLEEIGEASFVMTRLKSVYIPDSVQIIGRDAFFYNHELTTLHIGEQVTEIGDNAFRDACSLVGEYSRYTDRYELIIPDNVTTIGNRAFKGCNSLQVIHIGKGVTNIGEEAFDEVQFSNTGNCIFCTSAQSGQNITEIHVYNKYPASLDLDANEPHSNTWFSNAAPSGTLYYHYKNTEDLGGMTGTANYTNDWLPVLPSGWTVVAQVIQ